MDNKVIFLLRTPSSTIIDLAVALKEIFIVNGNKVIEHVMEKTFETLVSREEILNQKKPKYFKISWTIEI